MWLTELQKRTSYIIFKLKKMETSTHKCNRKGSCCLSCMIVSCPLTALLLVGVAVTLLLLFPIILRQQVEERVVIQEGSATFQQLLSPSVPVFKDIFFFNLSNPVEFEQGAKPSLVEIGPYSYRETREKTVLNLSADGSLLTYNQTRLFHFDQERTGGGLSERDTICTVNIPLLAAVSQLGQDGQGFLIDTFGPRILQNIFDDTNARLFVCLPPTQLAFQYTDELLQELSSNLALRIANQNIPSPFVSINGNNSAGNALPSVVNTGVSDIDAIGQYVQWQGNNGSLNTVWPNGMGANDINGTEGVVFRPFLEQGDDLEIFLDDTVRSFQLVYTETVDNAGIEAFRYGIKNSTFESAFTNPENARWASWCPDGMFFLGPTQEPVVPVFGSKPHFLDGDPILREKVAGLEPNRKKHDSFIDVEPITGANVLLNIQLQINAQVNQTDDFEQLENVNGTLYLPVLYISQRTVLIQQFVDFLLDNGLRDAYTLPILVQVIASIMIAGALFCLLMSLLACCLCARRHKKAVKSQPQSSSVLSDVSTSPEEREVELVEENQESWVSESFTSGSLQLSAGESIYNIVLN